MSSRWWGTWAPWGAALWLLGCGSKLQVDTMPPGVGGLGGAIAIGGSGPTVEGGTAGNYVGVDGGTGGITGPNAPGSLGQRCIPGATVTDAMGTFAQADVTQLDHCATGLDCGSDRLCAPIPDCPQAGGTCFVREPDPGANGGGGAGGSFGSGVGGTSSYSGNGSGGAQEAAARPEPTITGLAADDSQLYWVEYGTRDSLGNYRNDGTLLSFAFADGEIQTLASTLPGPIGVGVTSAHVYVYVDSAPLIGSPIHSQLLRLPLAGGATELVEDRTTPSAFLGVGDRAFWTSARGIEAVASSEGALPSIFSTEYAGSLCADASDLYFFGPGTIEAVPLAGGAAQSLGLTALSFGLQNDFLYGIEEIDNNTGLILDRALKSGGTWQRIRALGAGGYSDLQVVGDRLFWSSSPPQVGPYLQPDSSRLEIQTARFSSGDPPVRLLEVPTQPYGGFKWVGTATALYWTDGSAIYSRSLSDLP